VSACGAGSGTGDIAATVDLVAGGTATFTVSATVKSSATGTLSNTATVTAQAGVTDSPTGNNSATDDTTITFSSDLAITKTDGKTSVNAGAADSYTIVATNNGPSDVKIGRAHV